MALSNIPKQRTIDGLREVWASTESLISGLSDDQWRLPSPLPGWDVQANVAHVIGTEALLLGRAPSVEIDADSLDHVHNPIGAVNEAWVASYADLTPDEVVATFRDLTGRRLVALEAMSDDEWNAESFTPAGKDTYGRFMQIRVFDCWMHEQDVRVAVGEPGNRSGPAVGITLDEMSTAMGFVVGKKAGTPSGASVTFDLTGEGGRQIHVLVGDRAAVVPELDGAATATLSMPVFAFTRIACGRSDAGDHLADVSILGDEAIGRAVLGSLAYTI